MAIDIMLSGGRNVQHDLRHDLESVLYVIIWVCVSMEGPGMEIEPDEDLFIHKWGNIEKSLQELGHIKLAHVGDYQRVILPKFTPYWEDFKPFMQRLFSTFWPAKEVAPNSITPNAMLEILNNALETVQEPSNKAATTSVPASSAKRGRPISDFQSIQPPASAKRAKSIRVLPPWAGSIGLD